MELLYIYIGFLWKGIGVMAS